MVDVNKNSARKLYQSDYSIGGCVGGEAEQRLHTLLDDVFSEDSARSPIMQAFVPGLLGIAYETVGPVGDFAETAKLLYIVYRDIYEQTDDPDSWDANHSRQHALRYEGDHIDVYRDADGKAVLYHHYVSGDCGDTWFVLD